MNMWDYTIMVSPNAPRLNEEDLKDMGAAGWELVSVTHGVSNDTFGYFRRPSAVVTRAPVAERVDPRAPGSAPAHRMSSLSLRTHQDQPGGVGRTIHGTPGS